jgi:hypothetical protein
MEFNIVLDFMAFILGTGFFLFYFILCKIFFSFYIKKELKEMNVK